MPGQELEITAGVGAFSKAALPSVTINGASAALNSDGVAVYKTTANGAGEHVVKVNIDFKKPDGTMGHTEKEIKYTVGVPSGSSIFLEKMNVMYVGVENPVMISAGSAGLEKMKPSFTNGSLTSAGGGRFIAKPTSVGDAKINITVDGKTSSFPIRCKNLPDPTAMVGGKKGGSISSADFKAQGGVLAKLLDSDFDAPFQVVSYRVGANGGPFPSYKEAANDGPRWSGSAASLINQAGPGASIFFDQIRVRGVDGKERALPTLAFQLK
jgi:gliding motility-associated protein GldM